MFWLFLRNKNDIYFRIEEARAIYIIYISTFLSFFFISMRDGRKKARRTKNWPKFKNGWSLWALGGGKTNTIRNYYGHFYLALKISFLPMSNQMRGKIACEHFGYPLWLAPLPFPLLPALSFFLSRLVEHHTKCLPIVLVLVRVYCLVTTWCLSLFWHRSKGGKAKSLLYK